MTGKELQRREDWYEDWWQVNVSLDPWFQERVRQAMDDIAHRRRYRITSWDEDDVWHEEFRYTLICIRCLGGKRHEPDHAQCLNYLYDNDRCDCGCSEGGRS